MFSVYSFQASPTCTLQNQQPDSPTADMPAMTLQHSTPSCTMVKHHACQSLMAVSHMIACQQVGLQASMTVCKYVWGSVGATYRIMGLTKWEPI